MALDPNYLRGTMAAVFSILQRRGSAVDLCPAALAEHLRRPGDRGERRREEREREGGRGGGGRRVGEK